MHISRRQFNKLAMTSCALAATGAVRPVLADAPMTAQQLVDKIINLMGPAWNAASYRDTFKMGNPNTPVNGVASCFMSTFDVIKRAHEKGSELRDHARADHVDGPGFSAASAK